MRRTPTGLAAALALLSIAGITLQASSHREAPGITGTPKFDSTDFYMFRSYEPGRQDYVTLIANYVPLQDAYGGPNFFTLDPRAVYEIHIDNNGDTREDLTFQFGFHLDYKQIALNVGGANVPVPLINVGPVGPAADAVGNLNVVESYSINVIRGIRRGGHRQAVTDAITGSPVFRKPVDRIGDKSIADYAGYAANHVYDITIPGCAPGGRVFVGQRREGFVVNLAEAFDLVNLNPLGPVDAKANALADKNVTSLALEVPISCLINGDTVIGAWTTASRGPTSFRWGPGPQDTPFVQTGRSFTQVSRLGMPLVNELVIGLRDKDTFNITEPKRDAQFGIYVTNPTLPAILQALFGVPAPATPRNDLVQVFLTGVPGLNQPRKVRPAEMLRLNTAIPAVPPAAQSPFGVLGGDLAGFPNGRRPGDDVVDIALRAVEGVLLPGHPAAVEQLTDGALSAATVNYTPEGALTNDDTHALFRPGFPYLQTPVSGSPDPVHP